MYLYAYINTIGPYWVLLVPAVLCLTFVGQQCMKLHPRSARLLLHPVALAHGVVGVRLPRLGARTIHKHEEDDVTEDRTLEEAVLHDIH